MTALNTTLARPAATPPRPTLASLLKDAATSAKASDEASETTRDKTEAARSVATALAGIQKERRSSLKAQAKAQVLALLDRIRTLKQFASDNPGVMAKQLAAITRDLKSAIKAYADAGGSARDLGNASAPAPAAPDKAVSDQAEAASEKRPAAGGTEDLDASVTAEAPDAGEVADTASPSGAKAVPAAPTAIVDPRNIYEKMRDEVSGSEAAGDMDFVKLVRGVGKVIRDLLTRAKIQTALKGPDDETKKAFKETEEGLKEVDKALEKMDRDIRNASPAAGMFVALYA
ncbi:hypothetical protein [Brevundimonas goettingensis]|uniref:Uncharacterized protein n=1 Tax=Brevundimonas goettingensis TaxID=2774190 RepID=A0A975C1H5_9CAUL|nr:hypothetical protein [Brevundimonas goettingensis]QTC90724.1 hypothetical protein IFJ75_16020 [Brevundimonas goettingensis]